MAKDDVLTTDEKFELLIAALSQKGEVGITPEVLRDILAHNQQAAERAANPSNKTHPGISAFSYPEGDRDHPKAPLPYECFYNGYPVHQFPETEHWQEWELLGRLQPGEFSVIRKDGTSMKVTVTGERNAAQELAKVVVSFPISREDMAKIPPKYVVLYQLMHPENPRQAFFEAMQAHLKVMVPEAV